jgi:hypothetical protein
MLLKHPESWHAVVRTTTVEPLQVTDFFISVRDDNFAAFDYRDASLCTKLEEREMTLYTESGFERAGLVVDAGVNNSRIVPRLLRSELLIFFD